MDTSNTVSKSELRREIERTKEDLKRNLRTPFISPGVALEDVIPIPPVREPLPRASQTARSLPTLPTPPVSPPVPSVFSHPVFLPGAGETGVSADSSTKSPPCLIKRRMCSHQNLERS